MRKKKISAHLTLYRMSVLAGVGLVIGTISSFATIGFVEIVQWINHLLFVSAESRSGEDVVKLTLMTIATLSLGGLVVGIMLHYGVHQKKPLGPTDAIYSVQLREKLPTPLSGMVSTLASILSLGCGASVGQYGPLVYLGTFIGQLTNRLNLGLRDIRSIAIACGIAAAISTAFNAPIAGLIFTHEVILRHYSLRIFTAVTVASASGFVVANVVFQHPPLFLIEFNQHFHAAEFFLFALEGLACGLLAVGFMKLLQQSQEWSAGIKIHAIFKPMLAGFFLALVSLQIPEVLGAGLEVLRQATEPGNFTIFELTTILIAKAIVTAICIGFGFAGGVILPALLIGVLFGALFASSIPELLLTDYSGLSVYAVCGMVAVASPVIGAPMTALLIIFELTRHYEITVAAMVTIVFANLVSYHWYGRSLFDSELLKQGLDLSLGRDRAYLRHLKVMDYLSHKIEGDQDDTSLAGPTAKPDLEFDENTSLWFAMEAMRDYHGDAVPVVDSRTRGFLGTIPKTAIISAYLDAIHDLRREEHEA
ncbi:MAG: chloride channel protein [Gammaproteobacteria bacterium]|nr:chloride channel protein [Gammaproteobacteria bacterium]